MKKTRFLEVAPHQNGQRLDRVLRRSLPGVPLSRIHRALREGRVLLQGRRMDGDHRVVCGERFQLNELGGEIATPPPPVPPDGSGAQGLLKIVYRDDDILVVDKPAGISVHPGTGGKPGDSVVERALRLCGTGQDGSDPALVHRLDKGTSGVLLLALGRVALRDLHEQLRAGKMTKTYLAVVHGRPSPVRGTLEHALVREDRPDGGAKSRPAHRGESGRPSRLSYRVISTANEVSWVEVRPETGRLHQIRAQFAASGWPLVGDVRYDDGVRRPSHGLRRPALHARRIEFDIPGGNGRASFEAPLPHDLLQLADRLGVGP